MIPLNVNEAKAHLSKYLHAVEAGETVVLCRRNVPIAEIRALPVKAESGSTRLGPRPFGLADDRGEPLPASFFDELPDEVLAAFSGSGQ
jgi:antitoxin (DNA-binding transcriptional repressor) of toxin-antitoxin stability system